MGHSRRIRPSRDRDAGPILTCLKTEIFKLLTSLAHISVHGASCPHLYILASMLPTSPRWMPCGTSSATKKPLPLIKNGLDTQDGVSVAGLTQDHTKCGPKNF